MVMQQKSELIGVAQGMVRQPPLNQGESIQPIQIYQAEDVFTDLRFICKLVNYTNAELMMLGADIFYYRDEKEMPCLDNVMRYWVAIYRYCPDALTDDWRYLCSVGVFGQALRKHMREVIVRSWGEKWCSEAVEELLADPVLTRDVVVDVLTELVLLSEGLGNTLGELRIKPEIDIVQKPFTIVDTPEFSIDNIITALKE